MADVASHLTCLACRMQFEDLATQREHYKSPFHCFNLHRRSANLPAVNEAQFEERVATMKADMEAREKKAGRTTRRQRNAASREDPFQINLTVLANDLNRKVRSERSEVNTSAVRSEMKGPVDTPVSPDDRTAPNETSDPTPSHAEESTEILIKQTVPESSTSLSVDKEVEEEEEMEGDQELDALIEARLLEARAIPPNVSLFDGHVSETAEENRVYMEKKFGLFIPDQEYLIDLPGILSYLGEKVGIGYTCLWCDRSFRSLQAVQQHMLDKGHAKTRFHGYEDEFGEFFTWGQESEQQEGESSERGLVESDGTQYMVLSNNGLEMVLPGGKTLGHRALLRYYNQRTVAERGPIRRLRIAGPTATPNPQIQEKSRRDYRIEAGLYMRLGVKANKLQHHYRAQVDV